MRIWLCLVFATVLMSCRKNSIEETTGPKNNVYVKTHDVKVISLGFNGSTAKNLQDKVDTVLNAKPDLIVLMVGTNDVTNSRQENYRGDLSALVSLLQQGGKRDIMVLSPPLSVIKGYDSFTRDIMALRTDIQSVCTERNCMFVDINAVFREKESDVLTLFYNDKTHPTAVGYQLLAKTVLQAYVDKKLSKYNIVCFGDSLTFGARVNGEGTISGDTYPAQLYRLLNN